MWADFKFYYKARGKEELKSILLSLLAGFVLTLSSLALPYLMEVSYGEWTQVSEVLSIAAITNTIIRSLGGAVLYAAFPSKFKFRVTGDK